MYLSDKDILVQIKSDSGQAEGQWEEKQELVTGVCIARASRARQTTSPEALATVKRLVWQVQCRRTTRERLISLLHPLTADTLRRRCVQTVTPLWPGVWCLSIWHYISELSPIEVLLTVGNQSPIEVLFPIGNWSQMEAMFSIGNWSPIDVLFTISNWLPIVNRTSIGDHLPTG